MRDPCNSPQFARVNSLDPSCSSVLSRRWRRPPRPAYTTPRGSEATSTIATDGAESRLAGAKEALHRLLAQLERRARATATHGLLRPLVDHGEDRVRIILVELDIEIRAQPLPGLAGAYDR